MNTNSYMTFLTLLFILVDQVKFAPLRRKETDPYPDLVSLNVILLIPKILHFMHATCTKTLEIFLLFICWVGVIVSSYSFSLAFSFSLMVKL